MPAFSKSFSVELGTGYRANIAMKDNELRFFDLGLSFDSLSIYARSHAFYVNEIASEYDLKSGRYIHNRFMAHSQYVAGEGGFSDCGYVFALAFDYKHAAFGFGLGIQGGIAYSEYSDGVLYSLSPLVSADFALFFNPIRAVFYMDMASRFEHLWKASPLFGIKLEALLNDTSSIAADLYIQGAEYLMDPYFRPYTAAMRLSYRYRIEQ